MRDDMLTWSHAAAAYASRPLACPVHGLDVDLLMCEGGPRCAEIVAGRACGERVRRVDEGPADRAA